MLSPLNYRRILKFTHYSSVFLLALGAISPGFIVCSAISFTAHLYFQDCYERLCLEQMTAAQKQAYDFEQLSKQNGYFLDKQPNILTHFGEYQLASASSQTPKAMSTMAAPGPRFRYSTLV